MSVIFLVIVFGMTLGTKIVVNFGMEKAFS